MLPQTFADMFLVPEDNMGPGLCKIVYVLLIPRANNNVGVRR